MNSKKITLSLIAVVVVLLILMSTLFLDDRISFSERSTHSSLAEIGEASLTKFEIPSCDILADNFENNM